MKTGFLINDDLLEAHGACEDVRTWFRDQFHDDADLADVLKRCWHEHKSDYANLLLASFGSHLTALHEGLSVCAWKYLINCTGITALPDGVSVGGSLDLTNWPGLKAIPEGVSVCRLSRSDQLHQPD